MVGAAQDVTSKRGGVKDQQRSTDVPRHAEPLSANRGMVPILDAAPHHEEAWAASIHGTMPIPPAELCELLQASNPGSPTPSSIQLRGT